MNKRQVLEFIKQGEGINCEFKEAYDQLPKNLFETICSFLNTDGGTIFLGVNDKGEISGINPTRVTQLKNDLTNLSNNPKKIDLPYLLFPQDIDRYDDRLTIRTNLIDAYDLMMDFVEKHLNDPFYLEGDMRMSLRDKIFREAVSNIISHRDYISGSPGRLIIYKDKVVIDNPCTQHHFGEITVDNLLPYSHNPVLCRFMIQLGRFEELGSGVRNISKYLPLYSKGAKPVFKEEKQLFKLILPMSGAQSGAQSASILKTLLEGQLSADELINELKLRSKTGSFKRIIKALLKDQLIEYTIPDKPNSRLQKYRLTEKGKKASKAGHQQVGLVGSKLPARPCNQGCSPMKP